MKWTFFLDIENSMGNISVSCYRQYLTWYSFKTRLKRMTRKRRPLRRKKGKLLPVNKFKTTFHTLEIWRGKGKNLKTILLVVKQSLLKARIARRRRMKPVWRMASWEIITPRSQLLRGNPGGREEGPEVIDYCCRMTSLLSAVKKSVGGRREKYSEGGESEVKLPVSID